MVMSVYLSKSPSLAPRAGLLRKSLFIETAAMLVFAATMAVAAPLLAHADTPSQESKSGQRTFDASQLKKVRLDHSGHKRVGLASYYGHKFSGRKMADGTPMKPESDNAASRTLPLGTTAQVMNLRDGKTAVVTIRDRGPYAKGRIIDLSPRTAKQLGIIKAGVAQVEVTPMTVPQPNGTIKSVVAMSGPGKADVRRGAAAPSVSMTCATRGSLILTQCSNGISSVAKEFI